jgi:hypothetical protein
VKEGRVHVANRDNDIETPENDLDERVHAVYESVREIQKNAMDIE